MNEEYKTHLIFSDLEKYTHFYQQLESETWLWTNFVIKAGTNIDFPMFRGMKNTLESIKILLNNGKINDAFTLCRKYRDSTLINIYFSLQVKEKEDEFAKISLEDFNSDDHLKKQLNEIHDKNNLNYINDWIQGEITKEIRNELRYKKIFNKIKASEYLKEINSFFDQKSDDLLEARLNNHTHYNSLEYFYLNDSTPYNSKKKVALLSELQNDITYIFVRHFIWLFTLKDNYMMDSEHRDSLEIGMTPPKNSEYWVTPFIQEIFDDVIKKNKPKLAEILKNNTRMELK